MHPARVAQDLVRRRDQVVHLVHEDDLVAERVAPVPDVDEVGVPVEHAVVRVDAALSLARVAAVVPG